jgi:putative tricarboxylic transport membrane protein
MMRLTTAALLFASLPAWAADYSIMAPAAPGGGWDQTARTMQTLLQEEGISDNVQVTNVPAPAAPSASHNSSTRRRAIPRT